jgi:hypothetical protein
MSATKRLLSPGARALSSASGPGPGPDARWRLRGPALPGDIMMVSVQLDEQLFAFATLRES